MHQTPSAARNIFPPLRHVRQMFAFGLLQMAAMAAHGGNPAASPDRDDVRWLARITYGPDSASVARLRELGRRRFLDAQLRATEEKLPAAVQARIDGLEISHLSATQMIDEMTSSEQRVHDLTDERAKADAKTAAVMRQKQLVDQAIQRELWRAIYSPAQLKEQLVWFWLNHFNVYSGKVGGLAADYAEHAIRPHALGNFRDLLMATLTHPAMLRYLDNNANALRHVNENYARELLELHALGVDAGYTQHDVQELARILTGVGAHRGASSPPLQPRRRSLYVHDGAFEFDPAWHDFGDKVLLGHAIGGDGFGEVARALDLLVAQPACARFIARKLAVYFVADDPPAPIVDAMARTFERTRGDIAAVLETMFAAPEFAAALGTKFKDPMHFVVSSLRLIDDGSAPRDADQIRAYLIALEELPFNHPAPDGYSLRESGWASPGQLSRRFDAARSLGNRDGDPALYATGIWPLLAEQTKQVLALAQSPPERNLFLLASPEFNYR